MQGLSRISATGTLRLRLMAAVAVLLVAGCATGERVDPRDETVSLVYGYFDMKDAPSKLQWVTLKKYGSDDSVYHADTVDGLYLHVAVAPGSYQVHSFGGGGGLLTQRYKYNFATTGKNETAIRVQKPGVYYLGAYRYVNLPGGLFKEDKFEMTPLQSMSEKEVLIRVIKHLESSKYSDYTRQIAMAKTRLEALR